MTHQSDALDVHGKKLDNVVRLVPKDQLKNPRREIIWPTGEYAVQYVEKHERMEKFLKAILELPYDDKEEDYPDDFGNKVYMYLSEGDARDSLIKAINLAWEGLTGRKP